MPAVTRRCRSRRLAAYFSFAVATWLLTAGGLLFSTPTSWGVRYVKTEEAQKAVKDLDGSQLQGKTLSVELDDQSMDATKVVVTGLDWNDAEKPAVKEHFMPAGNVVHVTEGVGMVRFASPEEASKAVAELNDSTFVESRSKKECHLKVFPYPYDDTNTKVKILGLTPNSFFGDLKDYFSKVGAVVRVRAPADGRR
eukprot:TRINITY_DN38885_c0_g1_i1.p1 TRINITY_DN38885_c0_g1~~TRINITY_DN38885_c0_g1_i1.p1  ORF type:complete len:196 (-),score=43.74 TRINITY_DN38885_c0_g1_i1:307-894(-)